MRVLVAEDEPIMAAAIAEWLGRQAYVVDVVADGMAVLEALAADAYDVVVLERELPVVCGDDICRELALSPSGTRVLLLARARDARPAVGADDVLVKPFTFAELGARVAGLAALAPPARGEQAPDPSGV